LRPVKSHVAFRMIEKYARTFSTPGTDLRHCPYVGQRRTFHRVACGSILTDYFHLKSSGRLVTILFELCGRNSDPIPRLLNPRIQHTPSQKTRDAAFPTQYLIPPTHHSIATRAVPVGSLDSPRRFGPARPFAWSQVLLASPYAPIDLRACVREQTTRSFSNRWALWLVARGSQHHAPGTRPYQDATIRVNIGRSPLEPSAVVKGKRITCGPRWSSALAAATIARRHSSRELKTPRPSTSDGHLITRSAAAILHHHSID
jgi:hypothetical protein